MNDRKPTDRDRAERERAARERAERERAESGSDRADRCVELGLLFLSKLDASLAADASSTASPKASQDPLSSPELASHREACSRCAAEWTELLEFETGLRDRFEDPASIPAEVRASYVGAHRRAVSQFRTGPQRLVPHPLHGEEVSLGEIAGRDRATASERAILAPPRPGRFRFAAAILLTATLGILSAFLGSGPDRPDDGSLGLIRIERSGEGSLSPGEPFRLRASATREGYLTIVVSNGESIDLLFPHRDATVEGGFSSLGTPGFAIAAGESWEVPHPNYGEFTASLEPGRETYFLFTRPLSQGLAGDALEPLLREQFDVSLEPALRLARFESWLRGRYASVDRVEITVE